MKKTPTCFVLILLNLIAGNVCHAADTPVARPGIDHRPAVFPPILSLVGEPPTIYILRDPWVRPRELSGVSYDLKFVRTPPTGGTFSHLGKLPPRREVSQREAYSQEQIEAAERINLEAMRRYQERVDRRATSPRSLPMPALHPNRVTDPKDVFR